MCGILVTHGLKRPFSHRLLRSLRKRGPDQIGFWSDSWVQMAHARLAIIGLDERGSGPLENETHVLSFNGEIYNYNEIGRKLASAGVVLKGGNDAEVLLHAWSLWGPEILPLLNGFWAFVVYDKNSHRLTLVRDQFGVKPLYYAYNDDGLSVASMIPAIQDVVTAPLTLDYAAMSEYVRYQFTFGDKTFFKEIRKVLPGHSVQIDLRTGAVKDSCYEDLLSPDPDGDAVTPEWLDRCRELVRDSVIDSTVGDTPFTALCSGGLDSSLITRIAAPEMAYHCNYSDPDCNETAFARQAVEGTATRLFVVNAGESFDLVSRLAGIVEDFDELSVGSVILPLDDVLAQVRRRYKVVLTGTGGDELFAGYVRYPLAMGECRQESYRALFGRMARLGGICARFESTHRKGDPGLYRFYDPAAEKTFEAAFMEGAGRADREPLHAMIRFDRRHFLTALLNIDDKLCGRHGIEGRPSLLHQDLVRHLNRVHARGLLAGGELKPFLRSAASGILPESILKRTDKMGFTTPIGTFVNRSSHLIREQITGSRFRDLYDLRRMNLTAENKFSREVFGLLMLDLWLNRYAGAYGQRDTAPVGEKPPAAYAARAAAPGSARGPVPS